MISTPVGAEEKMVGAEERTVGAEEGRRAQETAKITTKKRQTISHLRNEITAYFFVFPPFDFLD